MAMDSSQVNVRGGGGGGNNKNEVVDAQAIRGEFTAKLPLEVGKGKDSIKSGLSRRLLDSLSIATITVEELLRSIWNILVAIQPLKETIVQWLPKYDRAANLRGDVISGLSVGIMLVPQGMAHAAIASSNPVMGLYAALVPVFVYACLGSSRHLAPGSGALVALMIAASVDKVPVPLFSQGVACEFSTTQDSSSGLMALMSSVAAETGSSLIEDAATTVSSALPVNTKTFSYKCRRSKDGSTTKICDQYFEEFSPVCQTCADYCFVSNPQDVHFKHETQSLGFTYTGEDVPYKACVDRCLENLRWERALQLSVCAGATLTILGILNFGYIVNFFSGPLLAGFTFAGGISIFSGQLKHLFGEDAIEARDACGKMFGEDSFSCSTPRAYVTILSWLYALPTTSISTLAFGFASAASLQAFRTAKQKFADKEFQKKHSWAPYAKTFSDFGVLWVVIVATGIAYHADEEKESWRFPIVGPIPKGLPSFEMPLGWERQESLADVVVDGMLIGLVAFLSSIVVAKKFANKFEYPLYSSQELMALGLANFCGSFFGAFPVQGSLSRTAVNAQNAKTQLASIITGCVVAVALVVLTEVAYYLPKACLAAIIMLACQELLDLSAAKELYHNHMYLELSIFCLSSLATMVLGILPGVLLGISCSLAMVIQRAAMPNVVEIARLPGTQTYRATHRYEYALRTPGVVIIRFDAPIFFANTEYFYDRVRNIVNNAKELHRTGMHSQFAVKVEQPRTPHWTPKSADEGDSSLKEEGELQYLIVSFTAVTDVDSTGITMLREFVSQYRKDGMKIIFVGLMGHIRRIFFLSGLVEFVGKSNFFMDVHSAVKYCARARSKSRFMSAIADVQGREIDWETLPDIDQLEVHEAATTIQRFFRGMKDRVKKADMHFSHMTSSRKVNREYVRKYGLGPTPDPSIISTQSEPAPNFNSV